MKNFTLVIPLLLLSSLRITLADTTEEIMPLSDIVVGIPSEELLKKHLSEKILMPVTNDGSILEKGLVLYDISENIFWNSLSVLVENGKVTCLSYYKTDKDLNVSNFDDRDFSDVIINIKPLFQQLKQELGPAFERKVAYRGKTRSAMYVWERENDFVVFLHEPVALYKKSKPFDCQLTIVPSLEIFSSFMATDSLPEDGLLWADAMGEEDTGEGIAK